MKAYLIVGYTIKNEYDATETPLKVCLNEKMAHNWENYYEYSLKSPYHFRGYGVKEFEIEENNPEREYCF